MQFNISKTIEENKGLVDTKFIYNKTFKRFEQKNSDNWIVNNEIIKKIILEPTGFAVLNGETDIYSSIINFAEDTRILSITPTNEHFIFYINGKEYIKTDISQVQIPDIEGIHYVYFNNNGALDSKNDFSVSEITRKYASVATIYWDAINQKATYIGDKRHSINTDAYQNYLNFINDKTVEYIEGTHIKFTNNKDGSVNNKVDGDGSSNYHTSFAIEDGKYKNYDLVNNSEHVEFNENIPILYKETVSQEKNWVAMATNDTKIVAIANDGECRVMYSEDDGETWEKVFLPFYSIWTDIIYGQNKFVAIASSGDYSVMISSDGISWTPIAVPQKNSWQSLVYSSELDIFVAVSLDGINRVMTSTNGSLWTVRTIPNYLPLKSITYSPTNGVNAKKFIAISEDDIFNLNDPNNPVAIGYSKAFQSSDGITWTNLNVSETKTWKAINYSNGIFVALASAGKHRLLNATNGNIWAAYEMTSSIIDGYVWTSLIYAFGYHMAVSSDGKFARSVNGLNWETSWTLNSVSNTAISTNTWQKIASNASTLVALSNSGTNRVTYSTNSGFTWAVTNAQDTKTLESIAYGTDKWVAVSSANTSGGRISYSSSADLSVWINIIGYDSVQWRDIVYGNGTYVAVGRADSEFKTRSATEANNWTSVAYGLLNNIGIFVAVASSGTNRVMTSTDTITWTARNAAVANSWTSIADGLISNVLTFVAVSSDGANRVMTSTDTVTWTSPTTPVAEATTWSSVTYGTVSGAGRFVAVANGGTTNRTMWSSNGTTWNLVSVTGDTGSNWNSVTFGNNLYVAVGSTGTNRIMWSANGTSWTTVIAPQQNTWTSVTFGNNLYVAVASDGTNRVMTSPTGLTGTWTLRNASAANAWTSVTYDGTRFIAVSNNGTMSSLNGIDWVSQASAENNSFTSIASNGTGLSIAVANSGTNRVMYISYNGADRIIYSVNGINWLTSANIPSSKNFIRIKYLQNGFFALTEDNLVYYSVTGTSNWYKVIFSAEILAANLTIVNFTASPTVISFLTSTNKIITTGVAFTTSSLTEGSFSNNRLLDVIDNLFFTSIANDGAGNFVAATRQNKVMVSSNNGVTWSIKDLGDSRVNKAKYISSLSAFFLLSTTGTNRIIYSTNLFTTQKNITTSILNYSIVDLQYFNSNYYLLLNSGDFRIIKTSQITYTTQESEISSLLDLKDAIKDIYNSWRKIEDSTDTEAIKNRCVIVNGKINYNKYENGFYTLQNCNDNKFYLYHIFMNNDKDNKYCVIAGNYEYNTKEEAKNSIIEEINKLNGLPFNDFLPLGTIVYEVNSTYTNSAKARIININGNNYHKLIKKDLISGSAFLNNNIAIKKENVNNNNLLNNTDLINLYGNKILEYALNKLQSLSSRDIDGFITRQEIVLLSGATTDISVIFGSQITGSYEIFDKNNPEIGMILFLKQNATSTNPNQNPDVNITSYTSLILPSKTESSSSDLLGVYIENYLVNFKNFSDSTINLVIYRKI